MDYEKKLALAKEALDSGSYDRETIEYIFPELKESEDEKVRKTLLEMVRDTPRDELWVNYNIHKEEALDWLEKQNDSCRIVWHNVSEEPREQEELLCMWDSDDGTWYDVVFYEADTKTFWHGEDEVSDVVKWAYINGKTEY